ncbi:response regulator [Paenibacillus sp. LMG 31459]|uniref:Response regulator n=1 Tax=Paenibacillus phytohabitans TaxID=2654978 RepID=A0ABX1YQM1_9BACL|nr:helix-turn-helix domain-containing protein [Paenibacillus phytohabitans]NOU83365.1 response regulator [Paenibacillus phytohabitans]
MNPYRVVLVEDEIPARTVFRHFIEERADLFTLVGEAEDGRDGLELFLKHKPELVVTDITMPGMNGLEMLSEIEKSGERPPQIIILTCHQDFHYAQQAIHLKAAAYLIKDDCLSDPGLLTRTMEELASQVNSLDETREKHLQLEQQVRLSEVEIEQSLFLDMLLSPAAEAKWLRSLEDSQLPLHEQSFKVLLLELDRNSLRFPIDQLEELKLWQFAGVNVLKELLAGIGPHKVIALDKGRFLAIYTDTSKAMRPNFPEQVLDSFAANLKMSCIALQCSFGQGLKARPEALKRLASAPYPFFYRFGESIAIEDWEQIARFQRIPEPLSRFWSKVLKKALLEPHLNTAALEQERLSLYRQAMEQSWDPEQIKSLYLRVFLDMSHNVIGAEGGADLEADLRKKMELCQTFNSVHEATCDYFRKLQQLQEGGRKIDASITRIIQHMREDLSYPYKLEELAASINYSVPYFSSMFKKAVGESFIQYLSRLRIEKAKLLLLTTDHKTFEISESIGFENYRSFNRIFKKEAGVSPSDYRRMGMGMPQ